MRLLYPAQDLQQVYILKKILQQVSQGTERCHVLVQTSGIVEHKMW